LHFGPQQSKQKHKHNSIYTIMCSSEQKANGININMCSSEQREKQMDNMCKNSKLHKSKEQKVNVNC
jgi:hypothetical protein